MKTDRGFQPGSHRKKKNKKDKQAEQMRSVGGEEEEPGHEGIEESDSVCQMLSMLSDVRRIGLLDGVEVQRFEEELKRKRLEQMKTSKGLQVLPVVVGDGHIEAGSRSWRASSAGSCGRM